MADRGRISAPAIAALEERGPEYVLGARERMDPRVSHRAHGPPTLCATLCPGTAGKEAQLFVKEVKVEGRRYILCRNEAEAAMDAADRQTIVNALDQQLWRGDKTLVGKSAFRRHLRTTLGARTFEIHPGKLADEVRYDGVFVLRSNARLTPWQAVLR